MAKFKLTQMQRLILTVVISLAFFIAEISVGFYTHSLALVADAFHYLSDLIGILVAIGANWVQERNEPAPQKYTFGYQRATLLGAFFNGVFLMALSVSILVQAVERFTDITPIQDPELVLIMGCVGFGLNVIVMSFLHDHSHHEHGHGHDDEQTYPDRQDQPSTTTATETTTASESDGGLSLGTPTHHEHKHMTFQAPSPGRDLAMLGVFIHVLGDAINNIGVIIAALIVWKVKGEGRYYVDPSVGVFIAVMIMLSAIRLVKETGAILLQIAPTDVNLDHVKHDIEMIPGIESIHELHVWRLNQHKSIASAHVVVDGRTVKSFTDKAKIIMECLHAYGIHSATLQPEVYPASPSTPSPILESQTTAVDIGSNAPSRRRRNGQNNCQLVCGSLCDGMRCCAQVQMQ